MNDIINSTLYTAEANESQKKSAGELQIEDPSPEMALAAIEKNKISSDARAKKLVSPQK